MIIFTASLALFAALAGAIHIVSCVLAARRCAPVPLRTTPSLRPASLVRPVCGLDHDAHRTLASSFALDHPDYEVIFCVSDADDPVLPLLRDLRDRHPDVPCSILVGRDRFPHNPKLDNCAKGWAAARHDWVVMADSNIVLPADYFARLAAQERDGVGLVSCPPMGGDASGFWAEVECAVLNGYQARIQYAVDSLGRGFAQGKTLSVHRSVLARAGGYGVLGAEPAEDAAATKAIRGIGLAIRLAGPPCLQPLGQRRWQDVWSRQVRWARLRRASFPLLFAPEILSGGLVPMLAALGSAAALGLPLAPVAGGWIAAWYGAEACLAVRARWPLSWRAPLTWLLRDAAIPLVYVAALSGRSFAWRGKELSIAAGPAQPAVTIATRFSVDCDSRLPEGTPLQGGIQP